MLLDHAHTQPKYACVGRTTYDTYVREIPLFNSLVWGLLTLTHSDFCALELSFWRKMEGGSMYQSCSIIYNVPYRYTVQIFTVVLNSLFLIPKPKLQTSQVLHLTNAHLTIRYRNTINVWENIGGLTTCHCFIRNWKFTTRCPTPTSYSAFNGQVSHLGKQLQHLPSVHMWKGPDHYDHNPREILQSHCSAHTPRKLVQLLGHM